VQLVVDVERPSLTRGDRVRFLARARLPPPRRNPGEIDRRKLLRHRGIGWEARLVHPRLIVRLSQRSIWQRGVVRLEARRYAAGDALAHRGDAGALLAGLGLGIRENLPEPLRRDVAALGIAHLLAVSGLHVGLVAAFAYVISRRLALCWPAFATRWDPRRAATGCAVFAALAYAAAAGQAVSAQRATLFAVLGSAALLSRRRAEPASILGCGLLAALAREPALLFAPGFQLSFAAVAALLLGKHPALAPPGARGSAGRAVTALRACCATTSAATLATAPLVAWHFQMVPLASLPANLVAIPWTSALLLPAALFASALAWIAPHANWLDPAIAPALAVAEASITWVERTSRGVPQGAPAAVSLPLCAFAEVVGVVLLATRQSLRSRVAGALLLTLLLSAGQRWVPPPRGTEAWFFSVGHGDAALVRGGRSALLIDAGTEPGPGRRGTVTRALDALRVRRLALLVVSHTDRDHRGGVPQILRTRPVDELWLPPGGTRDPAFEAILRAASARGCRIVERGLGDPAKSVGAMRVVPIWPPRRGGWRGATDNDRSLVVRVEHPRGALLFVGDLERAGEEALLAAHRDQGPPLRAEVLKVGHHGSRSSSYSAFLRAVRPDHAVISAAEPARFGLPAPEVVERIAALGAHVHRTGPGALRIDLERPWRVRRFRENP
jgi:competence protein ComEC